VATLSNASPVASPRGHVEQQRVAARDEQRDERGREIAILQRRREQMAFHVMHADEGAIACVRERLRVDDADEQRTGKARPGGHGDRVNRGGREARFGERAVHDGRQRGEMRAARELGHDAPEYLVDVLGQDDEARQLAVHQHGGRRFIA
jgi:hypothetical protein